MPIYFENSLWRVARVRKALQAHNLPRQGVGKILFCKSQRITCFLFKHAQVFWKVAHSTYTRNSGPGPLVLKILYSLPKRTPRHSHGHVKRSMVQSLSSAVTTAQLGESIKYHHFASTNFAVPPLQKVYLHCNKNKAISYHTPQKFPQFR